MKGLLRQVWFQEAVTSVFAGYMKLVFATQKRVHHNREAYYAIKALHGKNGAILCFWHRNIPVSPSCWELKNPEVQEMRALISRSTDGQLIARTMDKLDAPSIRGSRAEDPTRVDKGGSEALRLMHRWCAKDLGAVAVTPDGPRGPARKMGTGVPTLARMSGQPAIFVGINCRPALHFSSWDRMQLPLPFGRADYVWSGPFHVKRGDDLEAVAVRWEAELNRVQDEAEALGT